MINEVSKLLTNILEVFSGDTIFCTASSETTQLSGHYTDLLPTGLCDPTALASKLMYCFLTLWQCIHLGADKKLEAFTTNYSNLTSVLPIKSLTSYFVAEKNYKLWRWTGDSTNYQTIRGSVFGAQEDSWLPWSWSDKLLIIMEQYGGISCEELANQMRQQILESKDVNTSTTNGDTTETSKNNYCCICNIV